ARAGRAAQPHQDVGTGRPAHRVPPRAGRYRGAAGGGTTAVAGVHPGAGRRGRVRKRPRGRGGGTDRPRADRAPRPPRRRPRRAARSDRRRPPGQPLPPGPRTCPPPIPERPAVAVFAGDHGVHAKAVTPWPQEVTAQMVANFLAGGAVVNAFAREARAAVTVVDVAVAAALAPADGLVVAKVRPGTGDITTGPALTRDEAAAAVEAGIVTANALLDAGAGILVTGDMGIANTTPAAALIAAFTGAPADRVTGRGTGIDDAMLAHKTSVVAAALERHRPDRGDPLGVLARVGGGERAAIGVIIPGAAGRR